MHERKGGRARQKVTEREQGENEKDTERMESEREGFHKFILS